MEQLLLVMLLLAAAVAAGYFYLKRAQRRDATQSQPTTASDHPRDETVAPSETDRP